MKWYRTCVLWVVLALVVPHHAQAVTQVVRPMLGLKSFWSACGTIAGVERTMCDLQGKDANGGGTVLCVGHINHIKLRFRSSSLGFYQFTQLMEAASRRFHER